jgi:formamidopyrimidine-DNA glycosylase
MPELPEVEIIVRELREKIPGEELADIRINWKKTFISNGFPLPVRETIHSIDRRGKNIIIQLSRWYLIIHLRMTGKLIVSDTVPADRNHLQVEFLFKSGRVLSFYDPRKFGRIYLTADPEKFFSGLGIDALDPGFSTQDFRQLLDRKKGSIKPFLLDQHHLAGLGNIYADESLFRARIHPETSIRDLSVHESMQLYQAIRKTLGGAISHMGTTLVDYRTTAGNTGRHQNFLKVYDREQQACFRCKTIIEKKWVGGRGTHFCPACQPLKKKAR